LTAFGTTGDAKHFGKTQFTFLGQTIDDFKELKKSMESLGYGKLDFGSAKSFGKTANGNISAFFKSIMQGSAETKEQLKKDTEAIQSYIDEFTNSQGKVSNEKFVDIMSDASSQAKLYVQQTDAAALSTDAFAESQTRLAKISNSVVGGLKDIGAAIASAGLTLIASAAINFVVKSIMSAVQRQEDLRQAALEAGSALDKQSAAINDYKTQISSLKESLDKGNLSEQESYDVRKQLISIQDELVEKYGDEAAGIDLVNGKYQEQLDILNGIADQKAKDYLNEHNESINTAQEKMLEELNMQPGGFFEVSDTQAEKLQEIAAKYADRGLSIFAGDSSLSDGTNLKDITFNIKANATDAKDVLNDFMTDVRNANDRTNFLGDDLFNTITNNLADGVATAQSIIDKWGSEAETAAKYQIQLRDTWSKTYNDLTEAQETYNDAVAKNDDKAIAAALKKVKAAQDEFANTDIDNSFVQQYMQAQSDQLDESTKQSFAQQALNEGFSQAAQTYKECSKNLADLNDKYKQYGNISNTNRDVLKWNTENLKKYKDVIASWKWDVGVGDYSTVEGVSNNFGEGNNAVEIAYTPMLQTNSGLVPLSADTMDKYINILVEKATDSQTGKIDVDKLLALDAEGLYLKVNGVEQKISGMVAGVEGQIVNGAKLTAADVAAIAGSSEEELQKLFKQSSDYVGHSMHDVQDSVLRWKTLVEDENSFDPFKQFVESANLSEDKAEEVYKNIGLALDSIDKYGLQDIDILNIESLSKADHTLNNVTGDARKSIGAYLDLESAAEGLDIPLDTLIDTLVELGVVYSDNIKYTNEFTSSALTMATAASKAVSSVTSILNSQGTGVNVNTDSYSELIKDNAEYAAALQYSNGTMQLNREMAQQLTEAKVKESEAYIKVAYSQNQVKYEKVKNDLSYYTDEVRKSIEADADKLKQFDEEKAALESQSEAIRDNCRSLQMQYSALMQASSAYQDWLNAQNATESGDMYDSAIEAKKALAEGLKNGKIGTVKWQAASEFLIPDDYEGTAAEYIKKLNRYFKQASDGSGDGSGINNFITDSLKAGLMKQESDGSIKILADKTTEDFAKALKLSPDAVQSIFGEMQEYGWTFDWGSMLGDPITNYKMQLDDIKDQMADLEPNSEAWQVLDARAEELESALDGLYQRSGLDQLADTVQKAKDNGVELSENAQQAADALDSAARVQNEIDIYKAQEAAKEAEKAFASSGQIADLDNLDAANQKLTELLQKRQQMGEPTDTEIRLYLEEQEVNGKVPSDVIDDMKNAGLIKIETETDDNAAQTITSQYDTMKAHVEQPVTITANATKCITTLDNIINQLNTIDGSHTVTIKVNQTTVKSARTKTYAEQRAGAYGGAFAGGRTLVGELGNELVVNPHSGKWYTVGDNGAEFVNLPKDAIVFDHRKTKKLLDQGFIGGRGVALASGTAMDSGSPGRGSYVVGDGYKVGQDPRVKSTYKATKASTKATKDNSKALEENKKALEKQKTALEKQKTALEKESNKLKIYGQAAIDEIEKREKALNKEKDAQDKVYESQIKELEKRKTALQKANDEEDRAIKLAELQDALEKAKANRTVRIYNKNEGFVWRADQQAVSDAQNDLDDQKRQWKNDDILQAVDDEIERINNLKDAYDESIEAQIADLDDMKEKWNEVISLIGTSWEDYQLGLAAAAHFNDMTLDGMAGDLIGYKDDVLANMKEIGGVTDQIDSITESIEKLEEAISDAKDAASSGGGSGGSDSSASFGADTGADVEADSDLSQDTQDLLDKLEELREVYSGLGKDTDDLSEKQRGLVDTIANLTEGTKAHFNAVDELGTVQQTTADKQALMRDVLSEYMTTLSQCTDLTAEQRAELTQAMDDIVNSYSGGYDTIDKLIQGYNDTLIESGDMTNESYQQQLENLLEFADQNQASYDTIAEILNSNFEAVAENTDLTYWQRQSQITSLVDLANQYGVSSDDIINHLANIATQEQYAAESTDITHAAMMTTVQMACVEMGASYDSLRTKIESVTQAQQKMIEAIGKADFNTLMPMGTATSHGNKIQWGKPNFDPLQHATGVLNSPTTHIAITDEKGPEIKMRKPSAGNYSLIEKGTSVIPADASANIWKFGLDPESFIAAHMPQRSIKSVEITQPNTGNGVTVSVGDIQMYGVNDVESFGRVIHDRVSGIFAQEFSKR
jgi:hypothetical protein